MIWGRFRGWEDRITGWAGVVVRLRVLQTSEGQRFSSDACMARKAGIWVMLLIYKYLQNTLDALPLKPNPEIRHHVSGSVQNQQIWHGHS